MGYKRGRLLDLLQEVSKVTGEIVEEYKQRDLDPIEYAVPDDVQPPKYQWGQKIAIRVDEGPDAVVRIDGLRRSPNQDEWWYICVYTNYDTRWTDVQESFLDERRTDKQAR